MHLAHMLTSIMFVCSFYSIQSMLPGPSSPLFTIWGSISYYFSSPKQTVKQQIDSAIETSTTIARNSSVAVAASERSGTYKGISWSVITVKNESGAFLIQVNCSDPDIAKIYQDKALNNVL